MHVGGGAGNDSYTVTINKSMDIPANYPNGLYYEDGDNEVPINNGDKLKAGTVIYYEDTESSRQTEAYVDGVLVDYEGIQMPNKAVTIEIIATGYTPNFILAEKIDKKPDKWVTLTINIGEGKLYKYRNRGEYVTNASIDIYVNPLYPVGILYSGGESAYLAGYNLFAPDGKIIKTRINEKISANKVINIEYEKKPNLTLTLHNSKDEPKVINITEKTTYQDVLKEIRAAETKVQGKKLVCWSADKDDLKGFNEYSDYQNINSSIIYPSDYDNYLDGDYRHAINNNNYYYQNKTNVDLYEITTDEENHIVRHFNLNEYTKLNGEIEKYFSIKDTYIVKKDGKSRYDDEDIKYENIIWFGKDNEDNFYKILNFDNFSVEKLSKDTKVTEDSNVAFKNEWEETESKDRIEVYSSLDIEGDPKLDYTDEDNPTLDLSHMVLGIYEENQAPIYIPFEEFDENVKSEPANRDLLSYEEHNGKSIKVMYKGKLAYTGHLKLNNDGFDKDNITKIEIKKQPRKSYKIDQDPSETKLELNDLIVTLTSPKKGSTTQEEVTRDVPYAKFADYGLKVKMLNNAEPAVEEEVNNNTTLELKDDRKTLKVYVNDDLFKETDELIVKDGVFRLENTILIEKETDPTTKYVVGDELDLSRLTLKFTDSNDNSTIYTYDELKELGFNFALCGEDKKPPKTDDEIKEEFEEVINPMFADVASKEGIYEGSFDPQTRTVTVKILDKEKPFSELRGTGLIAGLVDLFNNNHLRKMQIGAQELRDLEAIKNNSADDSTFMQNIATIVALDMGNEVNGQGSNVNTLEDFVSKEVVLHLTVLDPETNNEVTIDYTIKGEDGQAEAPTENNEAGGGTGQGETCTHVDNVGKLSLKDDGKKITVTGPANDNNQVVKTFTEEYEISVEDKVKITYEFKSATDGKELPDEVKKLLPKEKLLNPETDYTAVTLNITSVKVEGGTWTFKGWEPANIPSITENTNIIGTWVFVEDKPNPPTPDKPVDPDKPVNPDHGDDDRPYWPDDDYYRPYRPYWPEDDYYRPYRYNNDDRRVAEEVEDEKPVEKMTETEIKAIATIGSKDLELLINGISSKKTMDVAAQIINSRTMIPLRYVAEALGFNVMWISETRTVVIYDDEFKVEIPVDTNTIIVNGVKYESDVKPQIVNNRTLLPIANIARALGLKDGTDILWNPTTRQATIIRRVYSK